MAQAGDTGTEIFVNLPVKDLQRSIDFFRKLGFGFDEQFTDENATCTIVNDGAYVMLLVENLFENLTKKSLVNAVAQTEAIMALSADSRQAVDDLVNKALESGGSPANEPMEEGPMYGWSFNDPDGHLWKAFYMDQRTGAVVPARGGRRGARVAANGRAASRWTSASTASMSMP